MKSKTIRLITIMCAALGFALLAGCDTVPSRGYGSGNRNTMPSGSSGGGSGGGHHH